MNRTIPVAIALLTILLGCEPKKENFEFTFFRWSIHEDYYLKINSSDTIYYVINNPIQKQTRYTILQPHQKEELDLMISKVSFPDKESYSTSVNDGLTYAFVYKTNNTSQKLSIHAHAGPKEFWVLGSYLENIKSKSKFIPTNKIVQLKEINDLVLMPFPPKINTNGH